MGATAASELPGSTYPSGVQGTVIPNFWLDALKNHPQLREIVESVDEPVLAYLQARRG